MRQFDTGATRDSEDGKLDYEGFLSPLVLERFAEYMHKHRVQADGNLRSSDNWQKGMPLDAYMSSMWRHFMDVWREHRHPLDEEVQIEALCAMLFNVQGYLFELLSDNTISILKTDRVLGEAELEKLKADFRNAARGNAWEATAI